MAASSLIARGGRSIYPNPGGTYRESEKLRVYSEIYNLGVYQSQCRYNITYSIFDTGDGPRDRWSRIKRGLKNMMGFRGSPEPVISHTLERSGTSHQASEDLTIDISALRAGHFVLRVLVRDRLSGQTAGRTRPFSKEIAQLVEE